MHNSKTMIIVLNLAKRIVRRTAEIPSRGLPAWKSGEDDNFDRQHGTRTSGIVWITNPWSKNFGGGQRYEGCDPALCEWAIENAGIDLQEFCFVDVGCGMGRPLVIASRYKFKKVIGVEYSKRLCKIAATNLRNCGDEKSQVVCEDATQFDYPTMNTFAFFYHPFSNLDILNCVMKKLKSATEGHELVVAYLGSARDALAASNPWLKPYEQKANLKLFRRPGLQSNLWLPKEQDATEVGNACL